MSSEAQPMKVLCPSCERLGELARARVEGAVLVVECTRCGHEWRALLASPALAAVASTLTPTPAPAPTPAAPATGRTLGLASSPAASNVVALRTAPMEAVERARLALEGDPFSAPEGHCPKCVTKRTEAARPCPQCGLVFGQFDRAAAEPPAWLRHDWQALLGDWGNEKRHDALRTKASAQGALAELARLYRIRLVDVPEDPFGLRARDELVRLVSVAMLSATGDASPEVAEGKVKLVLAVGGLLAAMTVAASMLRALLR